MLCNTFGKMLQNFTLKLHRVASFIARVNKPLINLYLFFIRQKQILVPIFSLRPYTRMFDRPYKIKIPIVIVV